MSTILKTEILSNLNTFVSHFNTVNFNEKNIIEIISIAFYGGKYISNSELQINNNNFDKYIKLCIDHYSNFIVKELSYFEGFSDNEYNLKVNNLTNEINEYIQLEDSKNNNNMSYKAILNTISVFIKNKYMINKNETLYISNPLYKKSFNKKYIAIDCLNYVEYLIINEHFENICSIISLSKYNNLITKNDIIHIKNECKKNNIESMFLLKLYKKIDPNIDLNTDSNKDFEEFKEFIQNILKNAIETPYYYEDKYKSFFEKLLYDVSIKINEILTHEHIPIFNLIENIKRNIIKKGIESNELIDNDFSNICISEIINNKLNINEFTSKMFYEYFMTFKGEAKNALSYHQNRVNNVY